MFSSPAKQVIDSIKSNMLDEFVMLISAPQIVGTEVWRFCSEVGQRKDCRISSQSDASIISVAVTHLKPHRIIYSHVIPERLQTCRKANMSLKDRYIYIYCCLVLIVN